MSSSQPGPFLTEDEARDMARESGNPSWYWSPARRTHVLISDGVTTPGDLAVSLAAGRADPAAVADYWVMAAQHVTITAASAVGEARQRDAREETFYSQADLAAAETHYAQTQDQLATLHDAAENLHYAAAAAGRADPRPGARP